MFAQSDIYDYTKTRFDNYNSYVETGNRREADNELRFLIRYTSLLSMYNYLYSINDTINADSVKLALDNLADTTLTAPKVLYDQVITSLLTVANRSIIHDVVNDTTFNLLNTDSLEVNKINADSVITNYIHTVLFKPDSIYIQHLKLDSATLSVLSATLLNVTTTITNALTTGTLTINGNSILGDTTFIDANNYIVPGTSTTFLIKSKSGNSLTIDLGTNVGISNSSGSVKIASDGSTLLSVGANTMTYDGTYLKTATDSLATKADVRSSATASEIAVQTGNGTKLLTTDGTNTSWNAGLLVYGTDSTVNSGEFHFGDSVRLDYASSPSRWGWVYFDSITKGVGVDSTVASASFGLTMPLRDIRKELSDTVNGEIGWYYKENGKVVKEYNLSGRPSVQIEKLQSAIEMDKRRISDLTNKVGMMWLIVRLGFGIVLLIGFVAFIKFITK